MRAMCCIMHIRTRAAYPLGRTVTRPRTVMYWLGFFFLFTKASSRSRRSLFDFLTSATTFEEYDINIIFTSGVDVMMVYTSKAL